MTAESKLNTIVNHMLRSVQNAKAYTEPFSHCYFENFFPPEIYAEMRSHFPADSLYKDLKHRDANRPDGTSSRKVLPFNDEKLATLDEKDQEFWQLIRSAFNDPRLKEAMFDKLSHDLKKKTGSKNPAEVTAYPKGGLFRDLSGYKILPHKDAPRKLVTTQFYLPEDDSQKDFGTSLYTRSLMGRLRHELNKIGVKSDKPVYERVKTFPFMPNTGYAFVVSDKSWHGREPIPDGFGDRYSLMNIYYSNPNEKFYD